MRKTQIYGLVFVSVFLPQFLYLRTIHAWEVDAHHDGIMYTAAIGFFHGLVPNRDFFAQYGPGAPILQGLAFKWLEPNLWSLKLVSSFFLAVIGTLLFMGARRKVNTISALTFSYLWVLSGPFGLPWSSIFSTTILVTCLLILEFGNRKINHLRMAFLFVGILLGLGIYIRIHLLASILLLNLMLLVNAKRAYAKTALVHLNFGFLSSITGVFALQIISDSLLPFIDQCIIWASGNYVGAPVVSISLIFDLLWIPFFAIFTLLYIFLYHRLDVLKLNLTSLVPFVFIGAFMLAVQLGNLERTGEQTLRNPKILLITASQKAQFSFQYLVLSVSIIYFLLFLVMSSQFVIKTQNHTSNSIFRISYAAIGISCLTQLYPFADNYHIAFITPVLILSSLFLVPKTLLDNRFQKSLALVAVTLLPMLIFKFILSANVERSPFESRTLKGMYGSWNTSWSLDSTMKFLELESPGIDFRCADGIYAGAGGRYLAKNEKFVTWGPPSSRNEASKKLFVCYASKELIDSYKGSGWKVNFQVLWTPMDSTQKDPRWNVLLERH